MVNTVQQGQVNPHRKENTHISEAFPQWEDVMKDSVDVLNGDVQ